MSTISYGKERPVALGSDEAARAQNRRVVTVVSQSGTFSSSGRRRDEDRAAHHSTSRCAGANGSAR